MKIKVHNSVPFGNKFEKVLGTIHADYCRGDISFNNCQVIEAGESIKNLRTFILQKKVFKFTDKNHRDGIYTSRSGILLQNIIVRYIVSTSLSELKEFKTSDDLKGMTFALHCPLNYCYRQDLQFILASFGARTTKDIFSGFFDKIVVSDNALKNIATSYVKWPNLRKEGKLISVSELEEFIKDHPDSWTSKHHKKIS